MRANGYYPAIHGVTTSRPVYGVGQEPAPASSFWSGLGSSAVNLVNTFAPAVAQRLIYGQAAQVVSTPQGLVQVQAPAGQQQASVSTSSQLPSWFWPAAIIGGGALLFIVMRKPSRR